MGRFLFFFVEANQADTMATAEDVLNLDSKSLEYDSRFPNQNQMKNCWMNYVYYHACSFQNPDDKEKCERLRFSYYSLCPRLYVKKWDDQRRAGVLAGLPVSMQGKNAPDASEDDDDE